MAGEELDRTGFDETTNYLTEALGRLIPQRLARWAIAVDVTTDRKEYAPGEAVEIDIEFQNRLPVPVTVKTPRARLWGWAVDGALEASEERRYLSPEEAMMSFGGRERKRITRRWEGTIRRTGSPDRWEPLTPGRHEISAFVAVEGHPRPEDRTTIEVR